MVSICALIAVRVAGLSMMVKGCTTVWKSALGLALTDTGFDYSLLSESRTRLLAGGVEQQLLDVLLTVFKTHGLVIQWVCKAKRDGAQGFPGYGNWKPEDAELRRLRRDNETLRQERDL